MTKQKTGKCRSFKALCIIFFSFVIQKMHPLDATLDYFYPDSRQERCNRKRREGYDRDNVIREKAGEIEAYCAQNEQRYVADGCYMTVQSLGIKHISQMCGKVGKRSPANYKQCRYSYDYQYHDRLAYDDGGKRNDEIRGLLNN